MIKKVAFILFALSLITTQKILYQKTKGYCTAFIEYPLFDNESHLDLSPLIMEKLNQPYQYLAAGKQCFVFESEDHTTVIKFLSAKRLIKNPALYAGELQSYKLAYNHLKEACKILGLKLGPSHYLPKLKVTTPYGLSSEIDLNLAHFIIQPKAQTLLALYKSDPSLKDPIHKATLRLIDLRLAKNILDKDPRIHRNIGVYNHEPFFLDIGSFYLNSEASEVDKMREKEAILSYHLKYHE